MEECIRIWINKSKDREDIQGGNLVDERGGNEGGGVGYKHSYITKYGHCASEGRASDAHVLGRHCAARR